MANGKSNQMITFCHEHGLPYILVLRSGTFKVWPLKVVK